jgi:hypothetical protein
MTELQAFKLLSTAKKIEIIKSKEFKDNLEKVMRRFFLVSNLDMTGLVFEERIDFTLARCGYFSGLSMGSHSSDSDIAGFSLKGNVIKRTKNSLSTSITSYRTTSHKTIEDKIDYIKTQNSKECGYLVSLREDKINSINYKVYLFENGVDFLDIENYSFKKTKNGYKGTSSLFSSAATISSSTSDQLIFTNIDVEQFSKNDKITLLLDYIKIKVQIDDTTDLFE